MQLFCHCVVIKTEDTGWALKELVFIIIKEIPMQDYLEELLDAPELLLCDDDDAVDDYSDL